MCALQSTFFNVFRFLVVVGIIAVALFFLDAVIADDDALLDALSSFSLGVILACEHSKLLPYQLLTHTAVSR